MPFYPFFGEGSSTKIDYRKNGTLILTSLLEDLRFVLVQYRSSSAFDLLRSPVESSSVLTALQWLSIA